MIYLFALTIFISSALLFLVEPMIARTLLPMLLLNPLSLRERRSKAGSPRAHVVVP